MTSLSSERKRALRAFAVWTTLSDGRKALTGQYRDGSIPFIPVDSDELSGEVFELVHPQRSESVVLAIWFESRSYMHFLPVQKGWPESPPWGEDEALNLDGRSTIGMLADSVRLKHEGDMEVPVESWKVPVTLP